MFVKQAKKFVEHLYMIPVAQCTLSMEEHQSANAAFRIRLRTDRQGSLCTVLYSKNEYEYTVCIK